MFKKSLSLFLLLCASLFILQPTVMACTGFIIGKDLTVDGSWLYGRTEDLEPNHNKTFVVHPRTENPAGSMWKDESNGFEYPLPAISHKYTAVPDVTPEYGIYDEAGFNEHGLSISATVSASADKSILAIDPYVENGLAESSMTSVVLQNATTARGAVELIAKIVTEKGSAEGNIVVLADKEGIWYMEILTGHQYVAIKFPSDKFAVFPNTFYLGHVNFEDTDNVIASSGVVDLAKKAGTYKEVNGAFHVAQSYNPPLSDANRSRSFSGIKSLDPDSAVTYDDSYYELLHSTDKQFSLADAMALQRNRFEGLDLKPLDEMELDGKGKPSGKKAVDGYAYPISNQNVMEAHIFQLKDYLPNELGGGVMWLAIGSPRNAPYLPYYGNITDTYQAYQDRSTAYSPDSWYWVISHINDMVAQHPKEFGTEVIDEVKQLEAQWIFQQDALDQEMLQLVAADPAQAAHKATEDSMKRAEATFARLKEIEQNLSERVAALQKETTTTTTTTTSTTTTQPTTKPSTNDGNGKKTNPATGIKRVYRLYSPITKTHLFTTDKNEVNFWSKNPGIWKYEGLAWISDTSRGVPVYRLYHKGVREHLYTKDANEVKILKQRGWRDEGIAFYANEKGKKELGVHRLYHAGIKKHLLTKDANEVKVLKTRGWKYEGIAWYGQQ